MRKFALVPFVCAFVLISGLASAQQQADLMVGGSTLLSSSPDTASQIQPLIGETGGIYPSVGFDAILKDRYGFNVEGAWRWKEGSYAGYEQAYRPIFIDVNALFQPRLGKRVGLDLMVGVGVESVRFDQSFPSVCPYANCTDYLNSNHFMEHFGGGLRYYFWHHWPRVFVRPEVNYYHIQNNSEFNSNNVIRAGATIGFTLGKHALPPPDVPPKK